MAKIYLNKSVSLELGPQASFFVSERNNFDVRDANTFDFAANAGLGLKITKVSLLKVVRINRCFN
jgi:hypothetical protein